MKIYSNDTDWIVAESREDAIAHHDALTGESWLDDIGTLDDWVEIADGKLLSIVDIDTDEEVTKTAAEWIKDAGEIQEAFVLASTEY